MIISEIQHTGFEKEEDKKAYITRMSELLTIDELEYRLHLFEPQNLPENAVSYFQHQKQQHAK